jgi:hypothetical protein
MFWTGGPPTSLDTLCLAVVPLRRKGKDDLEASAFFFEADKHLFLVTCFHALQSVKDDSDGWCASVHMKQGDKGVATAKHIVFSFTVPDDIVVSPSANLVAVRVCGLAAEAIYKSFKICSLETSGITIGTKLELMGFNAGLFDAHQSLPVVRSGKTVMGLDLAWNGNASLSLVSVEATSADAGAPLLLHRPGDELHQLHLLGVHCGGYNPFTGASSKQDSFSLGVFVKASFLRDIGSWTKMSKLEKVGDVFVPAWKISHRGADWFERLTVNAGKTCTDLDKSLWERMGKHEQVEMKEVNSGSHCVFEFEGQVLMRLTMNSLSFVRSESNVEGKEDDDDLDCIRLLHKREGNNTTVDAVYIMVVASKFRKDVVVAGMLCRDLAVGSGTPVEDEDQIPVAWNFVD